MRQEKRLIVSVRREIEKENEAREKGISCSGDEQVEFVNSKCYCSDHHDHSAFAPIDEDA